MDNTLEKIYKSGLKFLVPLTPEETYAIIVHEAVRLVKGDGGSISLADGKQIVTVYSINPDFSNVRVRKKGFTYQSMSQQKVLVAHAKDFKRVHPEIIKAGIKSLIFIPLSYRKKSMGVLTVRSCRDEYFSLKDGSTLKLFGSMASLAIRKSQLYKQSQDTLRDRDLFVALAAHELRTPLTTIHGYVQLLRTQQSNLPEKMTRWVEELSSEALRLTKLVNELLDISRINTGRLQYVFREHCLKEIVDRSILDFGFNHPQRKVIFENKLSLPPSCLIVGDCDKLIQVITNLLDNADKFSPPTTKILVNLREKNGELILSVKDQGKGIDKKDLSRVFDGFYKGDEKSEEGMGLGLFLVKNIITQHHGEVCIRSRVDKGTTVEIRLPRATI